MIKEIKYLFFFLIFALFTSCSFDNKTGIWSGGEVKKTVAELENEQNRTINVVKVYSSESFYSKEISAVKSASLTEPRANSSWQMAGLNPQNFLGNIHLSGIGNNFLKKKVGKDKFSISRVISSPLVFNDNVIFSDDNGTIFNIKKNGKIVWKKKYIKKYIRKYIKA